MKMGSVKVQEFLSKDILEEDFINTYKYTIYVQMMFGSCRIYVKDKFITPPTIYQKLYTVSCILIIITLYILDLKFNLAKFYDYTIVYHLIVTATGLDTVSFICNLIHVRFINCEANSEFYLKLQNIDRLMNIERNNTINILLYRINVATLLLLFSVFLFVLVGAIATKNFVLLCAVGLLFGQMSYVLEMAICSNIIVYFFTRLRFLNSIIANHLRLDVGDANSRTYAIANISKKCIKHLAAQTHDFVLNDTDVYLHEIFDAFQKFQYIYRYQVLIFCCKFVLGSLLTFEFTLYAIQKNILNVMETIAALGYIAFDSLTALILSIRCQMFYKEIKETKILSIKIMMKYQNGPLREKARRMLKMLEESPPCFSVYDMWQLDAHIFVKIFSLVTTLMVTLLQFAFL